LALNRALLLPQGTPKTAPRGQVKGSLKASFNRLRTPKQPFAYAQTVIRVYSNTKQKILKGHLWGTKGAQLKTNRTPIINLIINQITQKGALGAYFFGFLYNNKPK